jgi:hypothetical protein
MHYLAGGLAVTGCVDSAAGDRLVDIEVAVTDLQVEAAVRVGADPGFEVNRRALASEVRQRDQVPRLAFLALRKAGKVHDASKISFRIVGEV